MSDDAIDILIGSISLCIIMGCVYLTVDEPAQEAAESSVHNPTIEDLAHKSDLAPFGVSGLCKTRVRRSDAQVSCEESMHNPNSKHEPVVTLADLAVALLTEIAFSARDDARARADHYQRLADMISDCHVRNAEVHE